MTNIHIILIMTIIQQQTWLVSSAVLSDDKPGPSNDLAPVDQGNQQGHHFRPFSATYHAQ